MNKKILILSLTPLLSYADNNYFSVVRSNDYKIVSEIIEEVSPWTNIGILECSVDIENSDVYFNKSFNQIENCSQSQERTIISKIIEKDGTENVLSERKEHQEIQSENHKPMMIGTHLEESCDNIINKNYAKEDGIYRIGKLSDNFDVYCDMRETEGWTLVGKVNTSSNDNIDEPQNWFQVGQNSSEILSPVDNVNQKMSALGINNVNKIMHKNVAEFSIMSQDKDDLVKFYKEINQSNLEKWFVSSELTNVKTCTDSALSTGCESTKFVKATTYLLTGMSLNKVGYASSGDLHFRLNENGSPHYSSLCSYTFNNNNNDWGDTNKEHWGNALLIYIK